MYCHWNFEIQCNKFNVYIQWLHSNYIKVKVMFDIMLLAVRTLHIPSQHNVVIWCSVILVNSWNVSFTGAIFLYCFRYDFMNEVISDITVRIYIIVYWFLSQFHNHILIRSRILLTFFWMNLDSILTASNIHTMTIQYNNVSGVLHIMESLQPDRNIEYFNQ